MSSLFKRTNWILQFHEEDRTPQRKQFSLGTPLKPTADRLKAELDDLYQRGLFDPWVDDFRKRLYELKRPDKSVRSPSLPEAKEAFVESRQHLAPPSVRKYELVTRLFVEHCGDARMNDLTSEDAHQFLESRDLALTSKHNYLRHLSIFFRWCGRKGWMKTNPADDVSLRRKPKKRPKAFTKEEVDALVEKASRYLEPLIVIATRTGLRRSELVRLSWEDVDLEANKLHVTGPTKSGKERIVPLSEDAVHALSELQHRKGHVFYLRSPRHRIHPDTLSHDFFDLRSTVFPEKNAYTLHCLRHTFCTWMAEAGVPIHTIKALAGHSSIDTTMQYVHSMSDGKVHINRVFD